MFDGVLADVQAQRDLAIGRTQRNELRNLMLAFGDDSAG